MDISKPATVVDPDEDAIELNDDDDFSIKMETNFDDVHASAMKSENFVIQNDQIIKSEIDKASESDDKIKAEIKLKIDSKLEELKAMQMTQLKEKEATLKDKFEKLSTKIINSYPKYKQWLETNKKTFGSPICEIDGSMIPPPDQLKLPRWKIIFKKYGPHGLKETPIDEKTIRKELIWIARSSITEDKMELFPEHVKKAIDLIKEFLQEHFPPYIITPIVKEELEGAQGESTNTETKDNPKRIRYDLNLDSEDTKTQNDHNFENFNAVIKTNRKKELLVQLFIKNITPELIEKMKLIDCEHKGCKIKSLLLKKPPGKEKLETESIVVKGTETIDEYLLDIKIPVSSSFSNNTNLSNYVILAKTIRKYLLPNRKRTLLAVGCGLVGLMMANSSKKVYCIDTQQEIAAIQKYCEYNQLTNMTCISGTASEILGKLREEKIEGTVLALLDTNNQLSRDPVLISGFRKIPDLFRAIVMSKLAKPAIRTLLDLMEPGEKADDIGFPLMPKKACVVDLNPKASFFETIITFERKSLKTVATSNDADFVPIKKNLPQMQSRSNQMGPKNNLMGLKNTQNFKPHKGNNQAFRGHVANNFRGGFSGPRGSDNPKFQQMMQGTQFNRNNAPGMGNQGFSNFGGQQQQQKMQQFKMKQTMGNRPSAAPYQKNRQTNFSNQQNQSNQFNKNMRNQSGSGNSQDMWNKNMMQNMGPGQGNSWGGMSMNNSRTGNRNNFGDNMQGGSSYNQSNMNQNMSRMKSNSMSMDLDGGDQSSSYGSSNLGMFRGQGQMGVRNMQQIGGNQWFDKKNQQQNNWKPPSLKTEEHFYNDDLPDSAHDPWDNEDNQPMQPKNSRQNLQMQQQRNMMNTGQKKMGFNVGSNDVLPAKTFTLPQQRNQVMSSSTSTNSSQFNFPFQRRPAKNWGSQQSNNQSNNQSNVGMQSNFNQNRFQQQNFFNNRNNRQQFNMPQ